MIDYTIGFIFGLVGAALFQHFRLGYTIGVHRQQAGSIRRYVLFAHRAHADYNRGGVSAILNDIDEAAAEIEGKEGESR